MIDFHTTIQWLGWLGGGSLILYLALAALAPGVVTAASSWLVALSPLVKGVSEGLVWFAQAMWAGFKDMIDDPRSVLFMFVVAATSMLYMQAINPSRGAKTNCEQCIANLRVDYKFIKRTPAERRAYLKSVGKTDTSSWWEGFLRQ
jgi:hypothetical protein